jgi:hypothetical protein
MTDERKPLLFAMDRESAGVVVWFEGTAHAFTKNGAPNQLNYREKAVVRALLEAAVTDLDSGS